MIRTLALPPPHQETESVDLDKERFSSFESYLKDASFFTGKAKKIAFPRSEEQIALLLREANKTGVPITVSGAGTGLTGARVPSSGILLSTERMNRILSIQWNERSGEGFAVLQPGVPLSALEKALDEKSLFYAPNPGEKAASIGGTVATNASGSRSFKYGATRRHIRRLRVLLPNGDLLECARGQFREIGGIFEVKLSDGKTVRIPVPPRRMPKCKNAAGYFSSPGMDLLDLFIGSEGTLGVVTEIEVDVLRKPPALVSGLLFFPDEKSCRRFSQEIRQMAFDPRVLEFFDSRSLALLKKKHPEIPSGAGSALFFEQECGAGEDFGIERFWSSTFKGTGAWVSADPARQDELRLFRYHLPVLVNEQVAANGFRKVATDLAVPDESAEAMLDFYLEILPDSGIDYCLFGHLGENHLHANLLPKTEQEFARSEAVYEKLARKAVELGGTISAEHGIGKLRIPYLEIMVGKEGLLQMARVKKALDPNGILNPGNIVPAELLKEI